MFKMFTLVGLLLLTLTLAFCSCPQTVRKANAYPYTPQAACIARAVYHEARGEPFIGQVAVAHVVMNRTKNPQRWGKTPCDVVFEPKQFTDIDKCNPDFESLEWKQAKRIAIVALYGLDEDPTGGATHYFSHAKIDPPWWAKTKKVYARIKNHTFLGAINDKENPQRDNRSS